MVRVKKKKGPSHKVARIVGLTVLAVILLAGVAMGIYIWKIQKALSFGNAEEEARLKAALDAQEDKTEPFYMVLLGSDARNKDEASRSDVMMLARVDPETATVTLVSIPRDTMVELPEHGRSKINAAFAYDGAAGAVRAVKDFAGVPISHYAEIDFEGLKRVVDKLGGVDVDVPVSNNQTTNGSASIVAGKQHMNGEQALSFARERYGYTEGDFQRSENQRILLQAIIDEVMSRSPSEIPSLVESLAQSVSTDFSLTEIVSLANVFRTADGVTVYSAMVPSSTLTIDDVSYVVTDRGGWSAMMANVKAGLDPKADTVRIEGEGSDAKN